MRLRVIPVLAAATLAAVVGAAPADASFPGRNGRLAFVERLTAAGPPQLHTMRPDGTDRRLVVEGFAAHPAWSPRGRLIAFYHERPGAPFGIYLVRPNGTDLRFVTAGDDPTWSPDGSRLAFTYDNPLTGRDTIAIVNRDGTGLRVFDDFVFFDGFARDPAWSPTGGRIAFVMRGRDRIVRDLWMLRLRDGRLRNVTENVVVSGSHAETVTDPDWSPDGERLAFVQADASVPCPDDPEGFFGRNAIHTIRADGTGERVVTGDVPGSTAVGYPVWAPHGGGRLAYTSFVVEQYLPDCGRVATDDIALVSPLDVATNLTATPSPVDESQPSWQARP